MILTNTEPPAALLIINYQAGFRISQSVWPTFHTSQKGSQLPGDSTTTTLIMQNFIFVILSNGMFHEFECYDVFKLPSALFSW